MIFSASGWRGVFTESGCEEDTEMAIPASYKYIAAGAAKVFSDYLLRIDRDRGPVIVGIDTRPTGEPIADAVIRILLAEGREVRFVGICAAPEIMACANSGNMTDVPGNRKFARGFIYITASHNPIGHNGLKFGLRDGGVIQGHENSKLVSAFIELSSSPDFIEKMQALLDLPRARDVAAVYQAVQETKTTALACYWLSNMEVISGIETMEECERFFVRLKKEIEKRPLGIAADFNGSARTLSIDSGFFETLGVGFHSINDQPRQIVHRIVPEGESLDPCRVFLDELHKKDSSVVLGYVPDCDGDRGNLVVWDETAGKSRILEAQEVFVLACLSEFAYLHFKGDLDNAKAAIAVNDPTSIRIDRVAGAFGVKVFRAEVGEANVVGLARKLREKGYLVRILGEGSAGGTIIHPSSVRDPLNTLGSILKLLSLRSSGGRPGLFEIWCDLSGQRDKYREDFTLTDVITSLPGYHTTGAYTEDAVLDIKTRDHSLLKKKYQEIFLCGWEEKKAFLKERFGISRWEALAYNGMEEKRNIPEFAEARQGGLKINFFPASDTEPELAFIWMRGSKTEPVFRVMADAESRDLERFLIKWQRQMISEADNG